MNNLLQAKQAYCHRFFFWPGLLGFCLDYIFLQIQLFGPKLMDLVHFLQLDEFFQRLNLLVF
jgi:hypothetical protein